jgi:hypothetical protein
MSTCAEDTDSKKNTSLQDAFIKFRKSRVKENKLKRDMALTRRSKAPEEKEVRSNDCPVLI